MSVQGKLIVIVAPSGTGKSTIIKKIKEHFPKLNESVSCTTRSPREGEVHGKHYYFIDDQEFFQKKEQQEFLEWAQVHSHYYGTLKSTVDACLEEGKDLLFDLDVQGSYAMKKMYGKKAHIIFIEPPSFAVLESRLRGRGTESLERIEERLNNAKKELASKNDFDYLVLNDNVDRAVDEIKKIIEKILKG